MYLASRGTSPVTRDETSTLMLALILGLVLDTTGAAIAGAIVRLEVAGTSINEMQTATDGRFSFRSDAAGPVRLVVSAAGFASATVDVGPGDISGGELRILLEPAPFFEAVNVTSTRTGVPRADPTVTVTVIPAAELLSSAPLSIDDALKAVPGFTLFRRTSARVSNPTSQGVSLRGLGGTGASRSLVLANGIPLNDAFGGWVYWDKVPQAAIDRIEVQRGSGTDLYGADAVGGVVQILTVRPGRPLGRALLEAGNMGAGRVSLFGGGRTQGWIYSAAGQWFTTDGYVPVAVEQDAGLAPRGPVDTELAADHRSGLVTLGYQAANGWRLDASGNVFDEDRRNATPLAINSTASRNASAEVAGGLGGGMVSVRGFGGTQGYLQTYSTVNRTRTAEALTRVQRVPTEFLGVGGQWVGAVRRHAVLVGLETRSVEGTTIETPVTPQGIEQPTVRFGGTQRLGSAFAQVTLDAGSRLAVVMGAHAGYWRTRSDNTGYNKTLGSFNPRGSFTYRFNDVLAIRGSGYKGFRAPTLNEFYRGFRVGSTQTNPNEALLPERLKGADAGVLVSYRGLSARATAFWNILDDAITNVTLSTTPALITKQRANADKVRAAGVELEGDVRLRQALTLTMAVGILRSKFEGSGSLSGKLVPQVPRYNVGAGARYAAGGWNGSAQVRVTGRQYEDDQNAFILRRATVMDIYAGREVVRQVQLFVAVENLFDNDYDVGRTPILTTGLPRAIRAGVQIALP
jgi:outer membrane receptor protein involved in Fe transport